LLYTDWVESTFQNACLEHLARLEVAVHLKRLLCKETPFREEVLIVQVLFRV
jgi:hypothetical protein